MLIKQSVCFLVLCLLLTGFAEAQISEKKAVEYVKRLSPSILDSSLAKGRLDDWLTRILGESTTVMWELNDCGEQTGNPAIDSLRDLPVCVGVSATLNNGREVGISVIVGTNNQGLVGPPAISFIYLKSHDHIQTIKRLSDLKISLKKFSR